MTTKSKSTKCDKLDNKVTTYKMGKEGKFMIKSKGVCE